MQNKIGIIIQARMTSTRLPGKVMLNLSGKPVLQHVVERCLESRLAHQVIVASPDDPSSRPIVDLCAHLGVECFLGSENDVLSRYYLAAKAYDIDTIIRVTSDCPLIDPIVIDNMILNFELSNVAFAKTNYYSNTLVRTFPRGLDVEIFSFDSLKKAYEAASAQQEREHVTPYFYNNPHLFNLGSYTTEEDYSSFRLTLDTDKDYKMFQTLFPLLESDKTSTYFDVVKKLIAHPNIPEINSDVIQK